MPLHFFAEENATRSFIGHNPSRAVKCAAIAFAVVYVFPCLPVAAAMVLLAALIAALRVFSGQHYPSDVAAALLLSGVISLLGYLL